MTTKWTGWAVTVGAVLAITIGNPLAHASTAPQLTVSPTQGPPATEVTAVGTGFCPAPCSAVDVYFGGALVRSDVIVGAGGRFRTTFTVPATALGGVNTVYATQRDHTGTDSQASTTFRITPSTPVGGNTSRAPHSTPTTTSPRSSPTTPRSSSSRHRTRTAAPTTTPPSTSTPPAPTSTTSPAAEMDDSSGVCAWWWLVIGLGAATIAGGMLAWLRRAH